MFLVVVFTLPKHVEAVREWFDQPEQWRFTATIYTTDIGISRILRTDRPHVILTVAANEDGTKEVWHHWPNLNKMEYNIRKRWITYKDPTELRDYHLENNNLKHNVYFKENDKMRHPVVCVFITTYNSGSKIQRPIEALLKQTYGDWKCIIFDDSDDDGATWRMLKEDIEPKDHRILLYKPSRHSGMIGAVKGEAGLVASLHGDVVVEVDHDDYFSEDLLARLAEEFSANQGTIDFIHTPWCEPYELNPARSHYYGRQIKDGLYTDKFTGWGRGYGSAYKQWHRGNWVNVIEPCPINATTVQSLMSMPNHIRAWTSNFYRNIGAHNRDLNVADDFNILGRTYNEGRMGVLHGGARYFQVRNADDDNFTSHRRREIEVNNIEQGKHVKDSLMRRSVELGVWPVPLPDQVRVPTTPSHAAGATDAHAAIDALTPEARLAMGLHMSKVFPWWNGVRHENWKTIMVDKRADRVLGVRPSTISVVISTYNRAALLKRALQSVLTQTYEDVEIIVVGDCCPTLRNSMDAWARQAWLKPHLAKLHWWNLPEKSGGVGAYPRNYAVYHLVHTEWIAYLDDDNWWEPDHLQSLMSVVKRAPVKVAYAFSSMQVADVADPETGEVPAETKIYATKPVWGRVDTSSILHRRSLLERYGMWRHADEETNKIIYATDWDLVGRWARAGEHWGASVKTTLRYNCATNNQSGAKILDLVAGGSDQVGAKPGAALVNGELLPKPLPSARRTATVPLVTASVGGATTSLLTKTKRKKKKKKKSIVEEGEEGEEKSSEDKKEEKKKKKKKKKKKQ